MEGTFACLMSKTPAFIHTEFIWKYAQHDRNNIYLCCIIHRLTPLHVVRIVNLTTSKAFVVLVWNEPISSCDTSSSFIIMVTGEIKKTCMYFVYSFTVDCVQGV